jgi:hypothetical protein
MTKFSSLIAISLFAGVGGCGDGDNTNADAAPSFDARPIDRTDRAYVLRRIRLPTTVEQVEACSFVYPNGDYPVNKMGGLTTVMLDLLAEVPVQDFVDAGMDDGITLNTWIIRSGPVDEDDPAPTALFGHMQDADDDPTNNFDGTGQLRLRDGAVLIDAVVDGSLEGGVFDGTGSPEVGFGYDLQLNDEDELSNSPGVYARVRLDITEDTIAGPSASVISPAELHAKVYPGIAGLLTRGITDGVSQAATIKAIYDANDDDVVTVQELIDSDQMASLTQPDVDLDGDGINDHVSQGVMVEGVRVEIVD